MNPNLAIVWGPTLYGYKSHRSPLVKLWSESLGYTHVIVISTALASRLYIYIYNYTYNSSIISQDIPLNLIKFQQITSLLFFPYPSSVYHPHCNKDRVKQAPHLSLKDLPMGLAAWHSSICIWHYLTESSWSTRYLVAHPTNRKWVSSPQL